MTFPCPYCGQTYVVAVPDQVAFYHPTCTRCCRKFMLYPTDDGTFQARKLLEVSDVEIREYYRREEASLQEYVNSQGVGDGRKEGNDG